MCCELNLRLPSGRGVYLSAAERRDKFMKLLNKNPRDFNTMTSK